MGVLRVVTSGAKQSDAHQDNAAARRCRRVIRERSPKH
jgi:hypothetical protein